MIRTILEYTTIITSTVSVVVSTLTIMEKMQYDLSLLMGLGMLVVGHMLAWLVLDW